MESSSRLPDVLKRRKEAETLLSHLETAFFVSSDRDAVAIMRISKHLSCIA